MGKEHFTQMWEDALKVDLRAAAVAMRMLHPRPVEVQATGSDFWDSTPLDVIMEAARCACENEEQFYEDLKQLLVEHTHFAIGRDLQTGKAVRLYDPRVIDFDREQLTPAFFFQLLDDLHDPEPTLGEKDG